MDFREILTRTRLERHMTQLNLAEKIGVSLDVVVQWENGDTEPPIKDLIAISETLDLSVDQLLGKAEKTAEPAAETGEDTAGEVKFCPCCGREVKGNLCLACEFPITGYEEKGPKYAITGISVNGADYYETRAQLIKYCGITEEGEAERLYQSTKTQVLRRGLSDIAAHWVAARINPEYIYLHIVEDMGEPEEELVKKQDAMEKPAYIFKKENSIGVGGIILIVILTIIALSIF